MFEKLIYILIMIIIVAVAIIFMKIINLSAGYVGDGEEYRGGKSQTIQLYVKEGCPWCSRAEIFLQNKGLPFVAREILELTEGERDTLFAKTKLYTVPNIIIDGKPIGGYSQLIIWAFKNNIISQEEYNELLPRTQK